MPQPSLPISAHAQMMFPFIQPSAVMVNESRLLLDET